MRSEKSSEISIFKLMLNGEKHGKFEIADFVQREFIMCT